MERQRNSVVFNAPESNSNLQEEIAKQDKGFIQNLSRYLIAEDLQFTTKCLGKRVKTSNPENVNVSRTEVNDVRQGMSSYGQAATCSTYKARPMLVEFVDVESKGKIMKKLFRLANDTPDEMKQISVKHDMTPSEREHDKGLHNQALEMNEVNEDLNIKFKVMGPPWERKISKVNVRNHNGPRVHSEGCTGEVYERKPALLWQTIWFSGGKVHDLTVVEGPRQVDRGPG